MTDHEGNIENHITAANTLIREKCKEAGVPIPWEITYIPQAGKIVKVIPQEDGSTKTIDITYGTLAPNICEFIIFGYIDGLCDGYLLAHKTLDPAW